MARTAIDRVSRNVMTALRRPRRFIAVCLLSGLASMSALAAGNGPPLRGEALERLLRQDGARVCAQAKIDYFQRLSTTSQDSLTPNQEAYDATYYNLRLNLDPEQKYLEGWVTAQGVVTEGPLSRIELNMDDSLTVLDVQPSDSSAHVDDILSVYLDHAYATGEHFSFTVHYSGQYPVSSSDWLHFQTIAGKPHIWTLSEPFGARTWWPCKDYPSDKPDSVDIRVSVPTGLEIASNGRLVRDPNHDPSYDDGVISYAHWHEGHPIATYLVSLAIYPYRVYSDWYRYAPADSMELRFYNFPGPDVAESWEPVQAKVKDMIAAYEGYYGAYPFRDEKYGHAQFTWSGGMENQTITSLGSSDEMVVVHELAHQWWGDLVTCRDFHHVWLNEGFATYGEALWMESQAGEDAYRSRMKFYQYFGPGTVYVPTLNSWNRIFDASLSYYKGAWVVHMLRHVLGDDTFFKTLARYRERFAYGSATTDSLRVVAEQTWREDHGGESKDLRPFFQQWVYGEGYPYYRYDWTAVPAGSGWNLSVRIWQLQDEQIFTMPLDLRVGTTAGDTTLVVGNASADTTYVLQVENEPKEIAFDPDFWVLRRVIEPVPAPSFSKPLLLVNAGSWRFNAGQELRQAYEAGAFTGDLAFDFWDGQQEPEDGYPWTLPPPIGHGAVPGDVLQQYQTVIWVAGTDAQTWLATPIYSYLAAGGNVLLLSGAGKSFLSDPYRLYLGISFADGDTIESCRADLEGLSDLRLRGTQTPAITFSLPPQAGTTVLYKTGGAEAFGVGALRQPEEGGAYNPEGGRFAFLSGLPYRWNLDDLRSNIEFILAHFMPQKLEPGVGPRVAGATPNPFRDHALVRFYLPEAGNAKVGIWDVAGRRLRVLRDGPSPAGWNAEPWDGRDEQGHRAASGIYFVRLQNAGRETTGKIVRLR